MVNNLLPLRVDDLVVSRRGKRLLGPVSHTFAPQGLTLVIGPNGAGKTTFLKALHGIERMSGGTLTWNTPPEDARQRQSYVFQSPTMLRRSVRDNLAYPLWVAGVDKTEIRTRCDRWGARINLSDAMDRPAPLLSGGERQKLAIARALISDPDVLFLDEPCANLDGQATADIERMLTETQATGTRVIMTSHNLGQIRRLATDFLFVLSGHIHEVGPAAQLHTPATPELAAFLQGDLL
ncbi:ATP-binding cassette domain-containing protein [uncultured Tateyamaria sp.]|uniref:ATP-binding cassette domain-containing protein n=1 Tax=uncultured Tateyamaria sp. TaxID=455651 RepID=UPI002609AC2C|nr:ATP-binding cassette domain-containing protein [uncultured Tateyamaria sp.]